MPDRNFDDLAQRFRTNIYGNPKGEIRLTSVWQELTKHLPSLAEGGKTVWDAGGGLGQLSALLLEQGHNVILSDISSEMLAQARRDLTDYVDSGQLKIQQCAIQDAVQGEAFDVVVCHAVLEWVEEPEPVIANLVAALRPGGYMSLMFYNRNALILSNMAKGNLYKLRDEDFAGHPGGLTPSYPRDPQWVMKAVQSAGLMVAARRGVRLCYDLMPRAVRAQRSVEDMLAIDWQYGALEPFWQLGRYVHLLCRKPLD
ncbi:methyltransferase [Spongiibacter nanhainus]|uniref:tRNA 5-carboxymethoxyuridine methyltransferase n=1 Tax=Spongiibacter nanhainus TaxID=2794344 RepID=A0A7T4UQ94_9GAMM|nr:methyltransferase domain-containing protein [Spongiibacter nanhainus]QQD18528.1 methyltransferase [Spongiibacter nanhainus]